MPGTASGMRSLQTGQQAEALVRAALEGGGVACMRPEPDRGEDLLIELDGYAPGRDRWRHVRQGYVQVKGRRVQAVPGREATSVRRSVSVQHLLRWAALPSPVLVVAVDIAGPTPHFFARSVDDIVARVAPGGLDAFEKRDRRTMTITFPRVDDLVTFVATQLEAFYERHGLRLSGLSRSVIARNYYEVTASNTPFVPPSSLVVTRHLRVLWKSQFRPGHLWEVLNHLADHLLVSEGGGRRPLMVTMHVYRSLMDVHANNAVAHVSWLEDDHPHTGAVKERLGWVRAGQWPRFRVVGAQALDTLPEPYGLEVDDGTYLKAAERIWSGLDAAYVLVRGSLTADARVTEHERERLESAIHELVDGDWEKLGRPSTQYAVLDRLLERYVVVMRSVLTRLRADDGVPEVRRNRRLDADLKEAEGLYGAYLPLIQVMRGG